METLILEYISDGRITQVVKGVSLELDKGRTIRLAGGNCKGESTIDKLNE